MVQYKVHVGYDEAGESIWRTFSTLRTAKAYCEVVFQTTGIVLAIVEVESPK